MRQERAAERPEMNRVRQDRAAERAGKEASEAAAKVTSMGGANGPCSSQVQAQHVETRLLQPHRYVLIYVAKRHASSELHR